MTKKMLIDASHPEETRVVIVDSNRVEELDFESRHKRQLRGNVYLARVTRVEPSLQAAFVEYGGNRHGFLAFSEIHPDYYQIPYEDRMALIEAEEAESKEDEDAEDNEEPEAAKPKRKAAKSRSRSKSKSADLDDTDEDTEATEDAGLDEDENEAAEDPISASDDVDERDENLDPDEEDAADADDAEVADEQAKVASTRRKRMSRRRYKIQEVIKRGQILLIQAVKEERGNKGAAMTTYLSLAGRYCVLMPNTPRGGGISRKIANGSDRKRLKAVMSELKVPQGMGVIVRTAGAKRTKVEIKRDYDYLARLWEDIRENTLKSTAPALIHEEGNLVKRSIRDLYNKDIAEILVQGETAYKNAKAFIKMLMPSHAKFVKQYKDDIPLYLRYNVERQIEASLDSIVQLKSGGYLVIHPTEALVSVDVNSGRSTKERNVERTALRTNLEAAEEIARQMRLRDLAGLVVIDFIDMDENRNNRAVEKKMKDAISRDRARIQASRISQFGLMEISRQRRRRSLLEGSTAHCEHCSGVGRKRTVESSALAAIRAVEEFGVRGKAKRICLRTSPDVALYLFNEKRDLLQHVDETSDVFTEVIGDDTLIRPSFQIEVIEARDDEREDPLLDIEREFKRERQKEQQKSKRKKRDDKTRDDDAEDTSDTQNGETEARDLGSDDDNRDEKSKRRGRRGRRGGRGRRGRDDNRAASETASEEAQSADTHTDVTPSDETPADETSDQNVTHHPDSEDKTPRSRRRTRKAPPRKRTDDTPADETAEAIATESEAASDDGATKVVKSRSKARRKAPTRKPAAKSETSDTKQTDITPAQDTSSETSEVSKTAKTPNRSTARRKAPTRKPANIEDADVSVDTAKAAPKRKAPAKKTRAKKADKGNNETAEPQAVATKTRARRKAPAKTATPAKVKAPAKSATPAKKKAPAKKTAPKTKAASKAISDTEGTSKAAPKRAKRKAPASKTALPKSSPAQKKASSSKKTADTPQIEPSKVAGTVPDSPKPEAPTPEAYAPEALTPESLTKDTAKAPKKKGLWNRLLKS